MRINNGSANFADLTLMPPFGTAIQQLSGEVGTLDTRNSQPAKIDIKGKVDKYAPVTIVGELDPFDPLKKLDITTSFKRVELTTLTPYSGKFAGYRIRKGRLNLDLHYQIERSQLKAENKVLLEGLQLGEKVDSPDAVDLPVKLAVALLKDTKGNIDIQLPVAGDLNNPEFSVMPIVWQTLRNLVLRAVQAPFKFIAGLAAGGDEDLGTVPFAPGSDELSPEAQANLDKLAGALKDRPALRLEVEGVASAVADGPSIGAKRLELEYQNTYYRMLQRRGDKVPSDAKQLEVPENMQPALLEGIYRARLKQQPPAEWKELDSDERSAKMREAVIASWAKSQVLLRQIGQARATRIKDYLVEKGQMPDERIYLIDVSFAEGEDKGNVDTQLHLDSE
ncbi:outer membrane protein/peptidoglycan-associated (lipo)protein [Pseudomonas aeruginosa]|nr:outer membrane protein/peptidoglycan-associated (lipo)protein [Pseudomonas aeruginosa]